MTDAIGPQTVQTRLVRAQPKNPPLVFDRGPYPQVGRRPWNNVLSLLEANAVEAHQSGLGRQPQIPYAGLKNLEDATLRQALLGLPDTVDVLRESTIWIQSE